MYDLHARKRKQYFKSSRERKMRLGVRRPGSIPRSGTESQNDSSNYDDDGKGPSLSVYLRARRGIAVLTITLGGSPMIAPVLQRRKGYGPLTLESLRVPVIVGMLSPLLYLEQNGAA